MFLILIGVNMKRILSIVINYGEDNIYANADFKWLDENKRESLLLRNRFLFNKKYISQKNRI